jgi:hypothetical protein
MTKIDYAYYEWLTSQIDIPNEKNYDDLFERMHNFEFVWTVPNDDNRVQDGMDLRDEFTGGNADLLTLGGATFLEILVALSRRIAFTAGGNKHPQQWAWALLKNIGLKPASDPLNEDKAKFVDNVMHTVVQRTYGADGRGGFFPLQNSEYDQTKVEIWYQMNLYVAEMSDL